MQGGGVPRLRAEFAARTCGTLRTGKLLVTVRTLNPFLRSFSKE